MNNVSPPPGNFVRSHLGREERDGEHDLHPGAQRGHGSRPRLQGGGAAEGVVGAPPAHQDQFRLPLRARHGVARPHGPEDLHRCVGVVRVTAMIRVILYVYIARVYGIEAHGDSPVIV